MARLPLLRHPRSAEARKALQSFAFRRACVCAGTHAQELPASLQRGNNRQTIFPADADYQFFRDALVEAAGRFGLAIHGVVWMTNHIHLLASPLYADSIGKTLQSVGRP